MTSARETHPSRRVKSKPLAALAAKLGVFRLQVAAVATLDPHDGATCRSRSETGLSEPFSKGCRGSLNRGRRLGRDIARDGPDQPEPKGKPAGAHQEDPDRA